MYILSIEKLGIAKKIFAFIITIENG